MSSYLFRIRTPNLIYLCLGAAALLLTAAWWLGDLDIGFLPSTWPAGAARTAFGFFLGVLLWRYRPQVRPSRPKVCLSVALLVSAMAIPDTQWMASVAIVLFLLPVVVWLAASASYRSERPMFRILGDLSYPLYIIHIPALSVFCGFLKASHLGDPTSAWTYATMAPLIAASLMLDRVYDRPLRRILTRRLTGARPDASGASAVGSG